MRAVGVILAGGRGSRMGGADKALLPLGGAPMIAQAIRRLGPQVEALAINAGGEAERFAAFGLPVLPDPVAGQPGPLAGILAAMRWAGAQGATHVATAATDTPFLPDDLVARLAAALSGAMAGAMAGGPDNAMAGGPAGASDGSRARTALAESGGRLHPTFGLWSVSLADDLAKALASGTRRVGAWALEAGAVPVAFDASPFDPFFNVNTPADLAHAERLLAGMPS